MPDHMSEQELNKLINMLELSQNDDEPLQTFMEPEYFENDLGGRVLVRTGKIFVQDPLPGGTPAVISAAPPVVILVNGQPVSGPAEVTSQDMIEWEIIEPPLYTITVSEDRLQAFFTLYSPKRYQWKLNDYYSASMVEVEAALDTETVVEQLGLNRIITDFEHRGIIQNLNISGIHAELQNPTYQPITAAKGRAAVPGENAQLELFFSETIENEFSEIEGQVDFRSHLRIPSVIRGEVIARKIPFVEGIPGCDVYGEILYPPLPNDVNIIAKNNTVVLINNEIRALREGRPRVTGDKIKYFDITTTYIVPGNVNIKTGNILFSGDVIVRGNVEDNMIIESLGNVYVDGSIYNSTITATGSILVKGNVVNSKLYSGYFGVLYNRIFNCSKLLIEEALLLRTAVRLLIQAVQARKQSVKYGQAVVLLLESKFHKIPQLTKELLSVLATVQASYHQDLQQTLHFLNLLLKPAQLVDFMNEAALNGVIGMLEELHTGVARLQETKVEVNIGKCQNSTLKSNGDIMIHRDGIVQSELFSSGNISFRKTFSMCRGSKLEAGGSISAFYVGGESGAQSYLKAKQSISVHKMYLGRVTIDRYTADITEPVENMVFNIDNIRTIKLRMESN
ncbi:FapA family protein [Paenibacillus pedocola]|uniref:FapA family protein n=1 Tax=Paenibacillus pedocola TaxID=3242193 RepID=UPI0028773B19|nr:FapA family protein [Paenibacillus typhae]